MGDKKEEGMAVMERLQAIEDRIKVLEQQRDRLRLSLVALEGAIAENRQWLAGKDDKEEDSKDDDTIS